MDYIGIGNTRGGADMDYIAIKDKLIVFVRKYQYVLLILVVGIILMLLPSKQTEKEQQMVQEPMQTCEYSFVQQELSQILCKIEGAGKVEVMLTVSAGEQSIYQVDESSSGSESGNYDRETVIITDANRGQSGLVQQVIPPRYQGAIVVCQGANRAAVRLSIIEAVSKVTGLGADKISVLKMK